MNTENRLKRLEALAVTLGVEDDMKNMSLAELRTMSDAALERIIRRGGGLPDDAEITDELLAEILTDSSKEA